MIRAFKNGERRLFAEIETDYPDGLEVDAAGRVWSTAGDGAGFITPDHPIWRTST
jgi:sugar lactone lactonase YvrE